MLFKQAILYFQIKEGKVLGKDIRTGNTYSQQCEGLIHPRVLIGNFEQVEHCFNKITKKLCGQHFLSPSPIIIVHLQDPIEGGCTDIEARAFKEAALGAGAREAHVTDISRALSDQNILEKRYRVL